MDGVIDRLRGELGASLASARLAREAEEDAKQREEQVKAELVKVKQKAQVVEGHKRREADVSSFPYSVPGTGKECTDTLVIEPAGPRTTLYQ
jgi:L-fucose isomerase-like protein